MKKISEKKRLQNCKNSLKKANYKLKINYLKKVENYNNHPKLCLHCKLALDYKKHFKNKYCTNKCSALHNNPTKGRQRTDLEKENISKSLKGKKWNQEKKERMKRQNFIPHNLGKKMSDEQKILISKKVKEYYQNNPEAALKHSETMKNKGHTKETREIMSKKRSLYLENMGQSGFKHIKNYKIVNTLGDEYFVRGTWELQLAEWLNNNNILWTRKIYLTYFDGEINRTYIPDFYLPKQNIYFEVKGYFKKADKIKMSLVREQNKVNIIMCFKKQIKNLKNYNNLKELFKDSI